MKQLGIIFPSCLESDFGPPSSVRDRLRVWLEGHDDIRTRQLHDHAELSRAAT
jgi:hypothetical protein